jgi:hypothetical protein
MPDEGLELRISRIILCRAPQVTHAQTIVTVAGITAVTRQGGIVKIEPSPSIAEQVIDLDFCSLEALGTK